MARLRGRAALPAAAGTEVVLDVDNEKRIVLANRQIFFQTVPLLVCARL
jgi:hypothetical protein